MEKLRLKKVMLKVISDLDDSIAWVHLCNIDEELYYRFLTMFKLSRQELADYISKWIVDDFGLSLAMTHQNDICIFKELVKQRYKSLYPNMYLESVIDRQGWVRFYISDKIELEIKRYGTIK